MRDAQSGGVKKFVTFFQTERTERPTRCKYVGGGRDQAGMRSSSSSELESESESISGSGGRLLAERNGVLGKE